MSKENTLLQTDQIDATSNSINNIGVFKFEVATNEVHWNDVLKEIHQVQKTHIPDTESIYGNCKEGIHKENLLKAHNQALSKGVSFELEYEIITPKGNSHFLHITTHAINNDNKCTSLHGFITDITNTNEKTTDTYILKKQLEYAEKLSNTGSWKYDINTDTLHWSDNLYHIFEHDIETPITFGIFLEHVHKDDKEKIAAKFDLALNTKHFPDSNYRIVLKDGNIKTMKSIGEVITDVHGEVTTVMGTCQDITESTERDQQLIQKNQQLNVAEKMAMIGYWHWNTPINEVFWSDNLHAIYGHNKQEPLTFETYINYVHKEDKKIVLTNLKTAMKTGEFLESTYRIQLDDASIKIIKSVGRIILDHKGEVLEMSGTCQDITQVKKKELALLQKNQEFNFAEKIANIGSWQWNPNTNKANWSDNHYRIYGIEIGTQLDLQIIYNQIHSDDLDHLKELTQEILSNKKFTKTRFRIQLQNGDIKTLEVIGEVITDKAGNIILLKGTSQDITYRIEAEQLIQEKNQLLSFAEEMAMMGSWQWNPNTGVSTWSDNLYKIYDIEPDRTINMDLFLSRIHPDDIDNLTKEIETIVSTKVSNTILAYRIILNNGQVRSLELLAEVIIDSKGNVQELIGTAQDVTNRIQREQDLLEKNQLLNFAEQLSSIGYWKWDIINDVMEKSENLLKILDFEPGAKPDFKTYLKKVYPADREKVIDVSQRIIETKKFDKFHHRIVKNDNSIKTIKLIGEIILDKEGNVIELIGSSQDITEQIEAQQKILDTNRSLEKSTINLTSKNKQLAEFNHITSHNLRSPVSNLNALLSLYKSTKNEGKKIEIFGKFEIVIDHLTETLNALIETISIKHSAVEITQELCFEQTLLKTKEILAAELIESKANIKCDFSKAKNVKYNPIYLESIFLNLVSNSLKYRSEDRVPEISITSNTINGRITLEFEDNGLGIDMKSNGHKLFGLNKVFHKHPDAKGIGLFLTKAQIIAMGGSISAKSKVGVGTTFFIILN
ncbi:PAS domain-containing protein [Maribacter sp. BPC-D8]|uniref:PAS domain-containing sensor histidine kinase n=1 Tax=Maribacter sp. BPC-D8 TaxID=3053613 RepID=UPI002B49CC25|nr:PAS domain-containing protein [Maribacter sp. BPC-D8]WRI28071.1 PAS domain-containing protein [Maribacter sp. BPC-D8]